MRLLNRSDVESLLDLDACREAMAEAMADLSSGRAIQPLRTVEVFHDGRDSALFMPAVLTRPPVLGVKVVTIYPGNHAAGIASHHGAMLLFESEHGRPVAMLDGTSITAIRTAAVTALATELLARWDSRVAALIGTGVQAHSHIDALQRVRELEEIRVWSPQAVSRQRFLETVESDVPVRAVDSAEEAVQGADIVCTLTSAGAPVVEAGWIAPGTHINTVGASTATTRELDTETVAAASFFVDSRDATLDECGELLIPMREGRLTADHIRAELGEIVAGTASGRRSADEITLFNSLGLAVQDLAAAHVVLERAEAAGAGPQIDWE
jgi:ornithine cyclodeaminase